MSDYETIVSKNIDRKSRVQEHTKRPGTLIRTVTAVDKNTVKEGVPELFFIKGRGFFWVVKFNNELRYSLYTGLNEETVQSSSGFLHGATHKGIGIDPVDHNTLLNYNSLQHYPALDEDDMASNSAVSVATQQSIVVYSATQLIEAKRYALLAGSN